MRIYFIYFLLIQICFLSSCYDSNDSLSHNDEIPFYQEKNSSEFSDSITLVESGRVDFPLDSVTALSTRSIHAFTTPDGHSYYTFINDYNGVLYIYDFDKRKLASKIKLFNEGPNGVGVSSYLSHYMLNLDSIIICNGWTAKVYMINRLGEVLKKFDLPMPGSGKLIVGIAASSAKPLVFMDNKIYIIGHLLDFSISDHTKVKNVIVVDLSKNTIQRIFSRPELFNFGTWSGYQFELFGTHNNLSNKLVYSYAADPFIYEADKNGNILSKHYASSLYFKEISPFSEEKSSNDNIDISKLERHDYVTPQFEKILFDRFHNLYYRFAFLPKDEEGYKNPKTRTYRRETIVILDSSYSKVGEVLLPDGKFNPDMFFITKEGLHIAENPERQGNENSLSFVTYTIQTK